LGWGLTDRPNAKIYGSFHKAEINRVKIWTSERFCAQIVAGPIQGVRLQLVGGINLPRA